MSATATETETTMLILVDPIKNSNKFYEVTLGTDGTVRTRYGRVGEDGKPGVGGTGRATYERLIHAKKRKGYTEAAIAGSAKAASLGRNAVASKKARADLAGDSDDPRLTALIDRIVAVNAHEIKTLSGGKMTVRDGQVATPLGLLTIAAVDEAAILLDRLAKNPTDPTLLAKYLTLVPQSVGRSRDWTQSFFSGARTVAQQRTFLDQLRSSVQFAQTADDAADDTTDAARVFAYRLVPVDDKAVIASIEKMFRSTRLDSHPSARMRIANVYETHAPDAEKVFEQTAKRIGNVRQMWHGTRAFNVLSILATGLQVPSRTASNVTGRMFGDGLYFSEQSTKSLNYSRGGVWSSGIDSRALMFVADVAMGTEYHPNRHPSAGYNAVLDGKVTHPRNGKTFDSINVKAGTSGVRNHEAIVPGPSHVALRYLVEFEN